MLSIEGGKVATHTGHLSYRDGHWVITVLQEVKFENAGDAVLFAETLQASGPIQPPRGSSPSQVMTQLKEEIQKTARRASVIFRW